MSDFTVVQLLNQPTPVIITGGYVPRGAYAAGTDYAVGDSVDYNGSSYVMFVDAAAGTLPTDTTKWQVLANKGDTGSTGATGSTGSTGATGASITSAAFSSNDIVFTKDDTNTVTLTDAAITLKGATGATGGTGTLEDLGGATKALDNLASVAINTSLISDTDSTDDLGSTTKQWANVHTDRLVSTISDLVIENDLSDGDITFKVNDGGVDKTVMTLDGATGNVGIGTTSPGQLLSIRKDQDAGTRLEITNASSGIGALANFFVSNAGDTTTALNGVVFGTGYTTLGDAYQDGALLSSGTGLDGGLSISARGASANMRFYTGGSADANERMRILSTGNVGIGTTSPGAKLHLSAAGNPSFWLSNTTMAAHPFTAVGFGPEINGTVVGGWVGAAASSGGFQLNGFTNSVSVVSPVTIQGHLGNASPSMAAVAFDAWKTNGSTGRTSLAASEITAQWRNGGSPLMTLLGNGNVGIGTTSPTNILSLGGNSARTFWLERHTTANTAGNTLTVTAGGSTSGATDKAGGALILQGGLSTGSAESGVTIQGCVAGASGTTDRTQTTMMQVLGNKIGFYTQTPVARQVLATGAGRTVDDVITALQNLGLVSQS